MIGYALCHQAMMRRPSSSSNNDNILRRGSSDRSLECKEYVNNCRTGHATTRHLWFQSLFRYHWYKLSHNTLPDKRRRRAPNHGITLNPLFSLIFSRLTCSCWNESNLIWIGFYTVIFCTHSSETPHSPQDLKQHSWPLPF